MAADKREFKTILPIEGSVFTDTEKKMNYMVWKYIIDWDQAGFAETAVEIINITALKKRVLPISELDEFLKGKELVEVVVI